MPANLEKCVKDLEGKTNKRTNKPYTESERYAICNASIKKGHASADEDSIDHVGKSMDACVKKMLDSGKAKTSDEAKSMCESLLAKSGYDIDMLEINFTRL